MLLLGLVVCRHSITLSMSFTTVDVPLLHYVGHPSFVKHSVVVVFLKRVKLGSC